MKKLLKWVLIAFVGLIALGMIVEATKSPEQKAAEAAQRQEQIAKQATQKVQEEQQANVPAPTEPAPTERHISITIPNDERDFMAALLEGADAYKAAPNELKKSSVRKARDKKLQEILPSGTFKNWYGRLIEMKTTSDGDAYITLSMPDQLLALKTWNNSISDTEYKTLIKNGSPMYEVISKLQEEQYVKFSGHIFQEGSLTESGAMLDPEFITRFSEIEAVN